MREIMFRGKCIDDNTWAFGDYYSSNEMPMRGEVGHFIKIGLNEEYRVIPETVGQYIGEIDINNKEIYYGDILKVHDSRYPQRPSFIGVVDFQDASFVIKNDCVVHYRWLDYSCEVIGNKYENIELLEGDE